MEKFKLKAEKRKISGRKVKKLRNEGILPANIFGKGIKSLAIQVPAKDFLKIYEAAGETGIVELSVEDGESYPVLIHNLQLHAVTDQPLHVDFHRVTLTEKVRATVPLVTVGEAPAVAQKLGILLTPVSEIAVEALPTDLPEHIEVDISTLNTVDQEIKVKDLKISEKVTVLADPELVVVKIGPLVTEETKKILEEEKAQAQAAAAEAAAEKGKVPAEEVAPTPEGAPVAGEAKPEEKPASAKASTFVKTAVDKSAGKPAEEKK